MHTTERNNLLILARGLIERIRNIIFQLIVVLHTQVKQIENSDKEYLHGSSLHDNKTIICVPTLLPPVCLSFFHYKCL